MRVKCEYCHGEMDDKSPYCPNCGAPNHNIHQTVDGTPKTIEELKKWYADRKLPPSNVTRFFIGEDYKKPKAFGIYKDESTGEFVVYKNKADGSRAVRYKGTDEAYAVNELYMKLKSEILNQKENNARKSSASKAENISGSILSGLCVFLFVFIFMAIAVIDSYFKGFAVALFATIFVGPILYFIVTGYLNDHKIWDVNKSTPRAVVSFASIVIAVFCIVYLPVHSYSTAKYYVNKSANEIYCKYRNDWYIYDNYYDDYSGVSRPSDVERTNLSSLYSENDNWNSSSFTEFEDCRSYDYYYPDSSSDSDYDWSSSDSWDSGSTDWSSDW